MASKGKQRKLNDRQLKFCEEYIIDLNAKRAAIAAGYSEKTAEVQASNLLRNIKVAEKVQALMNNRSKRTEITADKVLQEIAAIAFADAKELFDQDGNMRPLDEIADTTAISEVTKTTMKNGNVKQSIKTYDKLRALELLGKHLVLFTDKIDHSTNGNDMPPAQVIQVMINHRKKGEPIEKHKKNG